MTRTTCLHNLSKSCTKSSKWQNSRSWWGKAQMITRQAGAVSTIRWEAPSVTSSTRNRWVSRCKTTSEWRKNSRTWACPRFLSLKKVFCLNQIWMESALSNSKALVSIRSKLLKTSRVKVNSLRLCCLSYQDQETKTQSTQIGVQKASRSWSAVEFRATMFRFRPQRWEIDQSSLNRSCSQAFGTHWTQVERVSSHRSNQSAWC